MPEFNPQDPHSNQPVLFGGARIEYASKAVIMLHGRGATADSILKLGEELNKDDKTIFAAPQAAANTWYPYSFLAPREMNEPGITSGLSAIKNLVVSFTSHGIPTEKIMLLGFSQGACITLEFAARNPAKYLAVVGLSGGLIGDKLEPESYSGNLKSTSVFLGCSDIDPHIPLERVNESEKIFSNLNASVIKQIYKGMGHTVNRDEINHINQLLTK